MYSPFSFLFSLHISSDWWWADMNKYFKKYRAFLIAAGLMAILTAVNFDLGVKALNISAGSLVEMLLVVPPVFVLLGLMDVWVPKETMIKYMGEGSGLKGILLAIFLGSAAAGPLYGAFPVAAVFMKKGVKFSNILNICCHRHYLFSR